MLLNNQETAFVNRNHPNIFFRHFEKISYETELLIRFVRNEEIIVDSFFENIKRNNI